MSTYNNKIIEILGKTLLNVNLNGYRVKHEFYVAKNSNQNLCGRDLMCGLGIEVNLKKE